MIFQLDNENRSAIELADLSVAKGLDWLKELKTDSLQAFKDMPLPSRKIEHWKYNETHFFRSEKFDIDTNSERYSASIDEKVNNTRSIKFESAVELVFIDGILTTDLDKLEKISGLIIKTFSQLSDNEKNQVKESLSVNQRNSLLNLNQALFSNGLYIAAKKNQTIETQIYCRHITTGRPNNQLTSNLVIVHSDTSSSLKLVEQFESQNSESIQLATQQTLFNLAENSQVKHTRLNLERDDAHQVSQVQATLGSNSVFNSFYLGLGSKLNRTDIDIRHEGQGAHCELTGIYLPANSQSIDYHSNIEHRVAHCTANEIFRGIIADSADATFNGKIHIFQDAQKSDAFLNNKNLLLTNQATVNTKPELEIYADDVKCAHGATVAQLDDKSVYYLQTRGISKKRAKKMLSIAFIQELIDTIKDKNINDFVSNVLDQYMSKVEES